MSPWIDKTRKNPYLVSKIVRHLSIPISMCWSRIKQLPSAFRNLFKIQNDRNISQDAGAVEQGSPASPQVANVRFQGAKERFQWMRENFRNDMIVRFGDSEFLKEMMTTIEIWENPYVQEPDNSLERLNLLLWGYNDLRVKLGGKGGLNEERKKMVESSASSGSPGYLLLGHEDEEKGRKRPLEMYYRPRPTDVQRATDFELMSLQTLSFVPARADTRAPIV